MCFGCSKELSHRNTSFECLKHNFKIEGKQPKPRFGCLKGRSHWDGSFYHTYRMFSLKKKKSYQPKKQTTSGHQRQWYAISMASRWWAVDGLRSCASWVEPLRRWKGDNIKSVNMVCHFTFNLYFHCCYCYMYMYDVILSSDFLFFILRPAKHRGWWGHNLQGAHFLSMLWQMFRLRHWKLELKLQTLAMTFYECIRACQKYPKTPDFTYSNYRLFERIPAVPGT